MERITIKVGGMSCEHCVKAVTDAVGALDGVAGVSVGLDSGSAVVDYDPGVTAPGRIRAAIEEEGYVAT